ncbi:hypothetical protein HOE39_01490 [Candidatus Woesearchaeota archaeon]|jgi:hypothetical protein|nr:hypothetical protein [Candidatus Woesearchaeota archaeon]
MAFSKQLTSAFDNALRQDQGFLFLEVKTGAIRDTTLTNTVARAKTLEDYLTSRDLGEPKVYSGAIGFDKSHSVGDLYLPAIDELDLIYGSNRFESLRLERILSNMRKEKRHSELFSVLSPEVVAPVKNRAWYMRKLRRKGHRRTRLNSPLNEATNGIIPEEYVAQMLGELIPTAQIFTRVNINGSINIPNTSGNLEYMINDEDNGSRNELDVILIAEREKIDEALVKLHQQPYRLIDLKYKLQLERRLRDKQS